MPHAVYIHICYVDNYILSDQGHEQVQLDGHLSGAVSAPPNCILLL